MPHYNHAESRHKRHREAEPFPLSQFLEHLEARFLQMRKRGGPSREHRGPPRPKGSPSRDQRVPMWQNRRQKNKHLNLNKLENRQQLINEVRDCLKLQILGLQDSVFMLQKTLERLCIRTQIILDFVLEEQASANKGSNNASAESAACPQSAQSLLSATEENTTTRL